MTEMLNDLGQPIGQLLPNWSPPPLPTTQTMSGRFCRVEALAPEHHAQDLYTAIGADAEGRNWTYLPYGPFASFDHYKTWLDSVCAGRDPLFFAIINAADGKAAGLASYLRIAPSNGSIEVGHIHFSNQLKGTPAATEAMFLMMQNAFELGYRRYEWKCDALNAASRSAAQRLGFTFEGLFRQATVYKGRNRDTAWYSIVDAQWPELSRLFSRWLSPDNFDSSGLQRTRLHNLTASSRSSD